MKDLLLRARVVVRTSNMKISRRRLADYVKTLHQKACCTCSRILFLHSTNQIIDLWRCRWRCRRQILNSLLSPVRRGWWLDGWPSGKSPVLCSLESRAGVMVIHRASHFYSNRPFAANDHVVQNPPCWKASSLLFPQWDIKTKASQASLVQVSLF